MNIAGSNGVLLAGPDRVETRPYLLLRYAFAHLCSSYVLP
jgi:hypothetical protein